MDNKDEKIIAEIKESLDYLDKKVDVRIPDLSHFSRMVSQVEEKKQKRLRKEQLIFMLTTLIILSIETYSFNKSITSFIVIQIISLLLVPVGIFLWKRKKTRQVGAR